jgi:hypothetical protein
VAVGADGVALFATFPTPSEPPSRRGAFHLEAVMTNGLSTNEERRGTRRVMLWTAIISAILLIGILAWLAMPIAIG